MLGLFRRHAGPAYTQPMPRTFFDDEGPGEHDVHLLDDDENDTVPCPHCGKQILAWADRCHRCGVDLGTEAWKADPPRAKLAWVIMSGLVIVAMLWFLLN